MAAELLWMRHSARPHQRRPGIRAAHPTTGQVGIFPLHRPALGQLWLTEEEDVGLDVRVRRSRRPTGHDGICGGS